MSKLLWERLHPDAKEPLQIKEGDAGFDLTSIESVDVPAGQRVLVCTGIAVAIPDGYVGLIRDRSSVARDMGLTVLGGVVDPNYRGEVMVLLQNLSPHWQGIAFRQRIAQLVIVPYFKGTPELVDKLPTNQYRGDQGFGSSGKF